MLPLTSPPRVRPGLGLATVALFALSLLALVTALPAAPLSATGSVTDVTLYKGQALVTRTIPLEDGAGSLEVVVAGLPESVVAESLFAEGGAGVEVRAVRFRSRAVGEEPREEVRKLDQTIEELREKMEVNRKSQEVLAKKLEYLDKLQNFVAPTAESDLSRGVLNAESLEKVTLFSFEQRQKIMDDQVKLAQEAKATEKEISLLERQKAEIASNSSKTVREAILFLEKTAAGKESVRVNYLVGNCGWAPTYVFRAGPEGMEVKVEYNALVHQLTGEDWSGVALTLSTASPALSAAGPGLAPFYVALTPAGGQQLAQGQAQQARQPQQVQTAEEGDVASQVKSISKRRASALAQNRAATNQDQAWVSNWDANAAVNDFQRLELLAAKDALSAIGVQGSSDEDGPSLSYKLDNPVSLASRDDQQMVRILEKQLPSRLYHVATPLLSAYVYREAEVTNSSGQDLLGGPVTAYLDGRFVGRAEIPTVTRGQTFVVGFGADPQLRARRELLSKTEGVQGGNREITTKYALFVENYKEEPVGVRIIDRLPYSSRTGDIRVTLKDPTDPLSEDKLYQRRERPKGILRWDVQVPARAAGEKARAVEYIYTVEYDRKFDLGTPGSTPQLQQEFMEMMQMRAKY